jgi:hypothetical protein
VAAGANDTFRQAGIAVGVAAFGAMIPSGDVLSGGSAQGFVDGLHVALIVGAAVAAIGAIASAKLLGVARPRRPVAAAEPAAA